MNKSPTRCFIENSAEIPILHYVECELILKMRFENAFQFIITEACARTTDVWEAIKASDEIWCNSYFLKGEPAQELFQFITTLALNSELKNKILVNLASSIPPYLPESLNIKYIYAKNYSDELILT